MEKIKVDCQQTYYQQCWNITAVSIKLVIFNGQAAQKIFKKYVLQNNVVESTAHDFSGDFLVMPSTSPANAATKREMKLQRWRALSAYL